MHCMRNIPNNSASDLEYISGATKGGRKYESCSTAVLL